MFTEYAVKYVYTALGCTPVNALGTVILYILAALLVDFIVKYFRCTKYLPPGPWGYPLVGFMPFMRGAMQHLKFGELAKKFGPMFSAKMGSQLVVVLSDHKTIRETFRRDEFTARPHTEFNNILGGYGIINSEGLLWKEQRRFIHDKLRKFGMTTRGGGREILEKTIKREVNSFIYKLARRGNKPTNLSHYISLSVTNIILTTIMSVRFEGHETRFARFTRLIDEGFKLFGQLDYINYVPVYGYVPWISAVKAKLSANRDEMANFFQKIIDEHRSTFHTREPTDLIDTYMHEIAIAEKENRLDALFHGKDHDRHLQQILGDLYSAGMETVKTTLEWAVVLMLHHPEAAEAVREELDQVVGRTRMPCMEDMPFLPVTEATILEVLRRTSIVPLGTTHATTKDVNMKGFLIPEGTQVIPLLHAVHMDEKLWDDPDAFRPSRFLNAEGKVHKPEYFMPFGVGRRMCLGDVLARMELFIFFSTLLHTYDLRLHGKLPNLQGNAGVTVTPDSFRVRLTQRPLTLQSKKARKMLRRFGFK